MASQDSERPVSQRTGTQQRGDDWAPPPPPPGNRTLSRQQTATANIESRILRLDRGRRYYRHQHISENSRESSPGMDDLSVDPKAVVVDLNDNGLKMIEIRSKFLVEAIKKVNKHPPLRPVTDCFTEEEPYATLFHHMDDIRREIRNLGDEQASLDLMALEEVTKEMAPVWRDAREEKFDRLVTYDMIWKPFHPGDFVVHEDSIGNSWLFVLVEITVGKLATLLWDRRPSNEIKGTYTRFNTWLLTWDGVGDHLKRQSVAFNCPEFSGQRPIKSLPVYPLKFLSVSEDEAINGFVKRGRQWWKHITERTACLEYRGLTLSHDLSSYSSKDRLRLTKRLRVDGRVIIDGESKGQMPVTRFLRLNDGYHDGYGDDYNDRQRSGEVADYRHNYQWDKLTATTELTDEQAMLCPPIIGCWELRSRQFYLASVANLRPVEWNVGAMDHIVLDIKKKDMLKGLVGYHYSRDDSKIKGDLISGKGQSLVILLHGPPGVGKTLTVESVAEVLQKPLISLSIGNMVWDESGLEERLESEFKRAAEWDAILLLDEADVVLEARSFEDIRRNGIVSIFLRQLEYYQGVLFLTTNRISTMDTAFQSRIQIGIGFQSMTTEIRAQVWAQLLALNGRDKTIGVQALRDVKQKLSKYELNGRQIRNVLNVAEGLAFNQYGEAGKLRYSHILEAVEAAVEFQKMLDDSKSSMKLGQTVWAPYRGEDND